MNDVLGGGMRPLTSREFSGFQAFVYEHAGIYLSEAKRALLAGRLNRRLRELQVRSFGDYLERARIDPDERRRMLDALCTNETHFFREPAHFDFLSKSVFPRWIAEAEGGSRARRVRIWSAGCSTGEEPYSLAMLLLEHFDPSRWQLEIVATDLSTKVLDRAVAGLWPLAKSSEIPERYLRKYMLKGTRSQEGNMKAGPAIRNLITFQQVNLNDEKYPLSGRFDLIFCRNVMIYFSAESKRRITDRLLDRLEERGHFFVGHSESLNSVTTRVETVVPTVYSLRRNGA